MRPSLEAVEVLRPRKRKEALRMLSEAAGAHAPLIPLAGGTDLFVGLNAGAAPAGPFQAGIVSVLLNVFCDPDLRALPVACSAICWLMNSTMVLAPSWARCPSTSATWPPTAQASA